MIEPSEEDKRADEKGCAKARKIPLSKIIMNPDDVNIYGEKDPARVRSMAKNPDKLPAIHVHPYSYELNDRDGEQIGIWKGYMIDEGEGHHRYLAYKRARKRSIPARICPE